MAVRIPKYRHHKPSGLAVVTIQGQDHYLGPYGSSESHIKYGQLIAQHATGVPVAKATSLPRQSITIAELILLYLRHAKVYYRKDGVVTDEYDCIVSALQPLKDLYGETEVDQFDSMCLEAVQTKMINLKWSLGYINKSISRIRRMFKHGIRPKIVKAATLVDLQSLPPLLPGRSEAVELPERFAVPEEFIQLVRADVNDHTRDIMDLILLTGARPGELCMLTGEMLDRSDDIWTATIKKHKMSHKKKARPRVIGFGPRAQLIMRKYLKADRKAKLFPVQRRTVTENIKRSCERLGLERWTSHWLRHNAATFVRAVSGLDAAQAMMGHANADTTEIYAHLDKAAVVELARRLG